MDPLLWCPQYLQEILSQSIPRGVAQASSRSAFHTINWMRLAYSLADHQITEKSMHYPVDLQRIGQLNEGRHPR